MRTTKTNGRVKEWGWKAWERKEKCLGQMRHRKMLLVKVVALVCLPFLLLLVLWRLIWTPERINTVGRGSFSFHPLSLWHAPAIIQDLRLVSTERIYHYWAMSLLPMSWIPPSRRRLRPRRTWFSVDAKTVQWFRESSFHDSLLC